MWTTETKDDKATLKEIQESLPPMWRLVKAETTRSGLIVELTPFARDTWRDVFYVPTSINSTSPDSIPHFRPLDDDLAKDIIKEVSIAEKVFKSFSEDIEIINEDYFRSVIKTAEKHIKDNKKKRVEKRKRVEEDEAPQNLYNQISWVGNRGTGVYEPYLKIVINSIDYEVLKEDFMAIAKEKRDDLIALIFKEAERGVYDSKKFDLAESLYKELQGFSERRGYKTFPEYQSIIEPVLSLRSVPPTDFLNYIKSVSERDNFTVMQRRMGLYIGVPIEENEKRRFLEDFGVLQESHMVYDLYTFNSFSRKEKEQYFALKELIPKLPNKGKQRDHILGLLDDLLVKQSISKEDLNYAMVIFGRFGLPEHQHLFGDPPRRENLQKVVLDSTSKQKVQILEEAVKRTSGYNNQVLSDYKNMIEAGQSLDSDQLKQIRALFYRIGMKPQTNSFRKARLLGETIMRRSASEVINDLETRVAQLEKQSARNFSLAASYHYVYQPPGRNLSEQEFHSKVLFEGPKKMFIPQARTMTNRHNQHEEIESFAKREVIREIGKIQKEIEKVFYETGLDPTVSRRSFESSGNKFEWVLVAQGRANEGERVQLAYVRTTDKTFSFYVAPSINIKILNTKGWEVKANYILNILTSELGMRTVRIG